MALVALLPIIIVILWVIMAGIALYQLYGEIFGVSDEVDKVFDSSWWVGAAILTGNPLVIVLCLLRYKFSFIPRKRWVVLASLIIQLGGVVWLYVNQPEPNFKSKTFTSDTDSASTSFLPVGNLPLTLDHSSYKDSLSSSGTSSNIRQGISALHSGYMCVQVKSDDIFSKSLGYAVSQRLAALPDVHAVFFQPDGGVPEGKPVDVLVTIDAKVTFKSGWFGGWDANGPATIALSSPTPLLGLKFSATQTTQYTGALNGVLLGKFSQHKAVESVAKTMFTYASSTLKGIKENDMYAESFPVDFYPDMVSQDIPDYLPKGYTHHTSARSLLHPTVTVLTYENITLNPASENTFSLKRFPIMTSLKEILDTRGWQGQGSGGSGHAFYGSYKKDGFSLLYNITKAGEGWNFELRHCKRMDEDAVGKLYETLLKQGRVSSRLGLVLIPFLPADMKRQVVTQLKFYHFNTGKQYLTVLNSLVNTGEDQESLKAAYRGLRPASLLLNSKPDKNEVMKLAERLGVKPVDIKTPLGVEELMHWGFQTLTPVEGADAKVGQQHIQDVKVRLNEPLCYTNDDGSEYGMLRVTKGVDSKGVACYLITLFHRQSGMTGSFSSTSYKPIRDFNQPAQSGINNLTYKATPPDTEGRFLLSVSLRKNTSARSEADF